MTTKKQQYETYRLRYGKMYQEMNRLTQERMMCTVQRRVVFQSEMNRQCPVAREVLKL